MFTTVIRQFTQSRKGHLALTAAAAVVALTAPSAAKAADAVGTVDQAFTITAMKASSGAQARVLGVSAGGIVSLQRPVAGSRTQQWAPAAIGAPAAASFVACLPELSCPFTSAAAAAPRALVNLASGECLTVLPRSVATAPCHEAAADERQRIHWNFEDDELAESGVPQRYTALAAETMGRLRCLTSTAPGAGKQAVKPATCTSRLRWEQQYRFTPVG